jgi:hypothetical protein
LGARDLTIRTLIRLQRRAGRKLIMMPEGVAAPAPKPRRDDRLIKALVRAHRWRRTIESRQASRSPNLRVSATTPHGFHPRLLATSSAPQSCSAF